MANVVPNISKGRTVELVRRVKNNDPSTSRLVGVLFSGTETDANLADYDDLAAVIGSNLNEIANGGYARVLITDTELASYTYNPDDTNNRFDADIPDLAFGSIATGAVTASTRAGLFYDPNSGGGDAAMVPLGIWDFAVTFDGTAVVGQVDAAGFFRAS